jgi:predicted dehydrogenase
MRVLVIGLGSMGKRRVRNLLANGVKEVIGFDTRADRRAEASSSYGIRVVESLETGWEARPEAAIISLPPHLHVEAELDSATRGVPFFVEAGVLLDGIDEVIAQVEQNRVTAMASCTMRYFPGPRLIKRVTADHSLGKPLVWQYQSGQYLPDWHPWEPISDYYVSRRDTGGCREIVPFELTWLVDVFGGVAAIQGSHSKVSSLDADIDDLYTADIVHDTGARGQLMVDVISRPPVRSFRLTCDEGTLEWDGIGNTARTSRLGGEWQNAELQTGHAQKGYINPEEPYIAEIADFLSAVRGERPPANTLHEDREILQALVALETTAAR